MTMTFEPELDITKIKPHPANPRRKAIADSEMVDSIREKGLVQPISVAPAEDGDGWILLAGHRRFDGCKKANRSTVPAIVHAELGTDAEQLEFAIIENVHREDLSPIEEAEAYHQFSLMRDPSTRKPYTLPAIARKTGRPVATIRERIKLLKLSKKTLDQVHTGQLTIGDGLQLVALESDPKLQAKVAKSAGTANFKATLEKATRDLKLGQKIDEVVADLTAAGVEQFAEGQKFIASWQIRSAHQGTDVLVADYAANPAPLEEYSKDHAGCLAFVRVTGDTYYPPSLVLVCTDRKAHTPGASPEEDAREAERAAERERIVAEAQAKAEARDIARTLRTTAVMQHVGPKLDGPVADVLRTLLPALVWDIDEDDSLSLYGRLMDLGVIWNPYPYRRGDADNELFQAHVDQITSGSPTYVVKAMIALLLVRAEQHVGQFGPNPHSEYYTHEAAFDLRYLELLEGLGHDFCDVDEEIRKNATPAADEGGDA